LVAFLHKEGSGAEAARALYAMASEPKELVLYGGFGPHATGLFGIRYGSDLKSRLMGFIRKLK
jgi:hypothetical protein